MHVAPGEAVRVRLELPVTDCSIVDAAGRRMVEPGEFEFLIGPSSRDSALLGGAFTMAEG